MLLHYIPIVAHKIISTPLNNMKSFWDFFYKQLGKLFHYFSSKEINLFVYSVTQYFVLKYFLLMGDPLAIIFLAILA